MVAAMKDKKLFIISRKQTFLRKISSRFIKDRIGNREMFELESPGFIIPHDQVIGYHFFAGILDTVYLSFSIIRSIIFKLTKFDLFNERSFKYGYVLDMPQFSQRAQFNPDRKPFSWKDEQAYQWDKFLYLNYNVQLEAKKEKKAQEIRERIGIPLGAPFACLHVRDTGFNSEKKELVGYRGSDIAKYESTVRLLIEKGYWVIRMGDSKMVTTPFKHEKYIDYAFSVFKSGLMDLYFIKHCDLFLGTDSGPCQVSNLFQRSEVYVNLTGWVFPYKFGDLGISKFYYSKEKGRFLSMKEYMQAPYHVNYDFLPQYPGKSAPYVILENSSEDIEEVVGEKLNQGPDYSYTALQLEFMELRRAQCREWIKHDPYFQNHPTACYRFAARIMPCRGTMGAGFLNKYWEYGEHLEKLTHEFKKQLINI